MGEDGDSEAKRQFDLLRRYTVSTRWATADLLYERALDTRVLVCTVCGFSGTRDHFVTRVAECQFDGGSLERYQCPRCDLVFGPLKMLDLSPQQLGLEYDVLYSGYEEANSTAAEIRAFHGCRPQHGGVYLNWGCGAWSETIDVLRADGWDVWGYEPFVPSQSEFVAGSRAEISARFDGVFSHNVIEHLRYPIDELLVMRSYLKPGGLMTHSTLCYDLNHEDTRFHLHFYLGRSVEVLARAAGLQVVAR